MGYLIILLVLGPSGWLIVSTCKRIGKIASNRKLWLIFAGCSTFGFVLGCFSALWFNYHVSPTIRYVGFPIPLITLVKQADGQWWDFIPNDGLFWLLGILANIVAMIALLNLPVFLISQRSSRLAKP